MFKETASKEKSVLNSTSEEEYTTMDFKGAVSFLVALLNVNSVIRKRCTQRSEPVPLRAKRAVKVVPFKCTVKPPTMTFPSASSTTPKKIGEVKFEGFAVSTMVATKFLLVHALLCVIKLYPDTVPDEALV